MRRKERIQRKTKKPIKPLKKKNIKKTEETEKTTIQKAKSAGGFYDKHYKPLLIIPFILLLFAIIAITINYTQTGEFFNKGVGLKGGLMVTIPGENINHQELEQLLRKEFPNNDIESRVLEEAGTQVAVSITADVLPENEQEMNRFINTITEKTGINKEKLSIETIGSSLGETFFLQTVKALFIAFLFMGFVVFLYFGESTKIKIISAVLTIISSFFMYSNTKTLNITALIIGIGLIITYAKYSIPSVAVILAAFSDIITTLAIVDIMGMKLSTAGIAAFLMLIGYSVDTDILLSTRVIKRKEGTVYDRVISAVKTGLTMNATTLAAVLTALILAESETIIQIMTILLVGLIVDMINTWLQNVGILRWHLEKKGEK